MHTMGVLLVEPPDGDETSAMELVREALEERLHLIPPFRRKLVQGPLKIGDPYWIEDPEFDLANHLSHHVLPAPGARHELDALIGELASGCLDRDKPLWEMAVIEGLESGQIALVTKVHHATMDGGKGAALMGQLFSTELHGEVPAPDEPWVVRTGADDALALGRHSSNAARQATACGECRDRSRLWTARPLERRAVRLPRRARRQGQQARALRGTRDDVQSRVDAQSLGRPV